MPQRPEPDDVVAAKALLAQHGYVVLREKSYRAAVERQRRAECMREAAEDARASAQAWARESLDEERRLRERLTLVYGVAVQHGATQEELGGCADRARCTDRLSTAISMGRWPAGEDEIGRSRPL